ncbi:MAG: hypothetical protein QOH90_1432, partial [Actinomycetota bacterium]|nr:hypothetical protein [Actinomycetota bacterium]
MSEFESVERGGTALARDRRSPTSPIEDLGAAQWLSEFMVDLGPIHEARDLSDLYASLARSVVKALGVDACLVSVLDDDGEVLRD